MYRESESEESRNRGLGTEEPSLCTEKVSLRDRGTESEESRNRALGTEEPTLCTEKARESEESRNRGRSEA